MCIRDSGRLCTCKPDWNVCGTHILDLRIYGNQFLASVGCKQAALPYYDVMEKTVAIDSDAGNCDCIVLFQKNLGRSRRIDIRGGSGFGIELSLPDGVCRNV